MKIPAHLYIHVPFCRAKCRYCGFHSSPRSDAGVRRWLDGLAREFDWYFGLGVHRLKSVYVGGGTPSILESRELAVLCGLITAHLGTPDAAPGRPEWTVEVNPDSLDAERAALLRSAGVTRVSLGAQSFDAAALRWLGRPYAPAAIPAAVGLLRDAGFTDLGLDLIAGAPREELAWENELRAAAALNPRHLSVYILSIEDGTPLARDAANGQFTPLASEAEAAILDQTEDVLAALGFAQYEISNYAAPGHACRHNLNTWRGGDYLGLGPSAASRVGRRRWTNPADLDAWYHGVSTQTPPSGSEELTSGDDQIERLLFQTRLNEGVGCDFTVPGYAAIDPDVAAFWQGRFIALAAQGLAELAAARWRLTRAGRRRADSIAESLLPEI